MAGQDFFKKIAQILEKQGSISAREVEDMAKDFKGKEIANFEYFLINEGLVEKPDLLRALSAYYEMPSFDVRGYFFNHDLVVLFPKELLLKHVFLPIEMDEELIAIVAGNPHDPEIYDIVREIMPYAIELRVGIYRDIIDEVRAFYKEAPDDVTLTPEQDEEDLLDIVDEL